MIFGHFLIDVNEANAFVVGCEETRDAALVDVADFDPRIEAFLARHELHLTTVFITHDHYDHTGGLRELLAKYDATVYSGKGHAGGRKTRVARHGDTLRIGDIEGRVVETPGHTEEGISLILPGMVFTGDALFAGSVGGTTNPRDAQRQVQTIREHILTLPDDYEIHTGHGPSSTVRIERTHNPFFV
ncbi:MAG TPA: MBL fold metallo-hydrolase [Candidatus Hydrogenedentes bacterium]|nr:MBL fold metallo-hydrolase [Candidatus Hydrogenedentota bacterium]